MKEQIEFIRKKCIEVNPSINDLKMGCYIEFKTSKLIQQAKILQMNHAGNYLVSVIETTTTVKPNQIFEILGRDIRLADVLLAIQHRNHTKKPDWWYKNVFPLTCWMYETSWRFDKDRIQDQTPETIEFIYNLLK